MCSWFFLCCFEVWVVDRCAESCGYKTPGKNWKAKEEIPHFSATVGVRRAHNIKQHACDTQDDTVVAGVFKESNGLVGQFGLYDSHEGKPRGKVMSRKFAQGIVVLFLGLMRLSFQQEYAGYSKYKNSD